MDRRTGCTITKATGVGGDDDESWTYDALDRLTQAADDDSIVNLTYDSLSRVLTEQQGSNPLGSTGKTVTYAWNAEDEQTKIADTEPGTFLPRHTVPRHTVPSRIRRPSRDTSAHVRLRQEFTPLRRPVSLGDG